MGRYRFLRTMSHYCLFMVISCFGTVRLQYIKTGGPGADSVLNSLDSQFSDTQPYNTYYQSPTNNIDDINAAEIPNVFYNEPDFLPYETVQGSSRGRRTTKQEPDLPDFNETQTIDKIKEKTNEEMVRKAVPPKRTALLKELAEVLNAGGGNTLLRIQEKKNFSPWGGKRRDSSLGNINMPRAYMWKRNHNGPASMPKRVRFSPWGGKRNGQVLYKQGPKNSRIIFSTNVPIRIMANYLPYEGLNLAGLHVLPMLDKRQAIKFLALPSDPEKDIVTPDGTPVKSFLQMLPKMFKPGRPYFDVDVKKDGKRKVKFSAWGGKRSPPIIGPIWTPASDDIKDATLNALVLIRNSQNYKKNDMENF